MQYPQNQFSISTNKNFKISVLEKLKFFKTNFTESAQATNLLDTIPEDWPLEVAFGASNLAAGITQLVFTCLLIDF